MRAGTLKNKKCRVCGEMFRRGVDNVVDTEYCSECHVQGFYIEAYEQGCNVPNLSDLGKEAYVIERKVKDCPVVIINGISYRDTTSLLYESSKNKVVYSGSEEYQRIDRYKKRKRKIKKREREKRLKKEQEELEALKEKEILEKKNRKLLSKMEREEKKQLEIKRKLMLEREILRLYNEGTIRDVMSAELNISKYMINKIIKELEEKGLITRCNTKIYPPEEEEKIIELKKLGYSNKEIGEKLNRTESAINGRLTKLRKEGRIE